MALRRVFVLVPVLLLTLAGCFRQASDPVDLVNETRLDTPAVDAPLLTEPDDNDNNLSLDSDATPTLEMLLSTPILPVTIDAPGNQPEDDDEAGASDTRGGVDLIPMYTATLSSQMLVVTPGAPSGPSAISTPAPPEPAAASPVPAADVLVTPTDMFFTDRSNVNPACIHLVRRGDTLFRIALANNTTVDAIRQSNPSIRGDIIQPGDEIILPGCDLSTPVPGVPDTASVGGDGGIVAPIDTETGGPAAPSNQGTETIHTVRSGETLGAIATRYGVTINAIVQRNNLSNPNVLSVGQQLIIPAP